MQNWTEQRATVAAAAPADARASFIRKTYAHLGGAVLLFVALQVMLDSAGVSEAMLKMLAGSRYSWLLIMIGFMGASAVAERFASQPHSVSMQYAGLALYVVAEAFVFLPLIYIAAHYMGDRNVLQTAAVYTGLVFGGMTAIVFVTGKDFSFMRQALMVAGWGALGLILCSILFGFTLGTVFCGVMVLFAAGYILYHTSNILHHYPVGAHVAASLALFASVALLFWYILQILMSRRD